MNWTLRDNGWVFGFGAAILSFPITFLMAGHFPSLRYSELLLFLGFGFGLVVGCKLAYRHIQAFGYLTERVAILTAMSLGLAFLLASAALSFVTTAIAGVLAIGRKPDLIGSFADLAYAFFFLWPVSALAIWIVAAAKLSIPFLALILAWSWFYLAVFGPRLLTSERRSIFRHSIHQEGLGMIRILFWSLLGIVTVVVGLGIKLPAT